jgi:hypothetical protein
MLSVISVIRPGTQAAEGLSKADLDKRMKVTLDMLNCKEYNIIKLPMSTG